MSDKKFDRYKTVFITHIIVAALSAIAAFSNSKSASILIVCAYLFFCLLSAIWCRKKGGMSNSIVDSVYYSTIAIGVVILFVSEFKERDDSVREIGKRDDQLHLEEMRSVSDFLVAYSEDPKSFQAATVRAVNYFTNPTTIEALDHIEGCSFTLLPKFEIYFTRERFKETTSIMKIMPPEFRRLGNCINVLLDIQEKFFIKEQIPRAEAILTSVDAEKYLVVSHDGHKISAVLLNNHLENVQSALNSPAETAKKLNSELARLRQDMGKPADPNYIELSVFLGLIFSIFYGFFWPFALLSLLSFKLSREPRDQSV